ncbi:MAG: 16S rRNA pseudouridine(516) synthase [Oscillospiraceae bacterium]|nr:16S rRNA pseudouridine(516) synthase [Oscillospiraceae bacterium]
MRLDKYVADVLGVTRSEARTLIRKGKIFADGAPVTEPGVKAETFSEITSSGERLDREEFIYIMMNKPSGVVSATEDSRDKTVLELLPDNLRRRGLFPAGRLDKDSEGFLLLTNDGQLAHNVLSPKKKVGKKYFVDLACPLEQNKIDILEKGVDIGGYTTQPCKVELIGDLSAYITITEGKFHQVKRMFEAIGNRVLYLKRVSFAGLELDEGLLPGEYRQLCTKEITKILRTIQ